MPILIFENLLPAAGAVATGAGLAVEGNAGLAVAEAGLAGIAVVCEETGAATGAAAGAAELLQQADCCCNQPESLQTLRTQPSFEMT
jgi:Mg2+/Co2+ transporter CorB